MSDEGFAGGIGQCIPVPCDCREEGCEGWAMAPTADASGWVITLPPETVMKAQGALAEGRMINPERMTGGGVTHTG